MAEALAVHALKLAAYVFGVIFVAELPDKTALAALILATKYRALPVFLGASLALTMQSLVAVAAGSLFSLLPPRPIHLATGLVFLVSAVLMWLRKEESETTQTPKDDGAGPRAFWRPMTTVFGVVFVAEWGDLTQIATAAFAAHERAPLVVFAASTLALWAVTGIAVGVGNRAGKMLNEKVTKRVAAILFATVGVALIAGYL